MFCVDLTFSESDFLKDLLSAVPLFTQDGNYYRWAHKSLQEYFAAQFIYLDAKDQQSKILLQLYNNPSLDKFINILDLYYDIDAKAFRSTILFHYLSSFKDYIDSTFQDSGFEVSKEEISLRKEICYQIQPFVFTMPILEGKINDDKLDDMISKLGKNKRISGSLDSPNFDRQLYCLIHSDVKEQLCFMLVNKLPRLFNQYQSIHQEEIILKIDHPITEHYESYILDDKADSPIVTPKYRTAG